MPPGAPRRVAAPVVIVAREGVACMALLLTLAGPPIQAARLSGSFAETLAPYSFDAYGDG